MQEVVVREDELLLTLGSYHSPMALCIDEFGLVYTGHAQVKSDPLPSAAGQYLPLLECRCAFMAAQGCMRGRVPCEGESHGCQKFEKLWRPSSPANSPRA